MEIYYIKINDNVYFLKNGENYENQQFRFHH